MQGDNNGKGSRISLRDSREVQQPRGSGASTPIRDRDNIACAFVPTELVGPMPMILIATRKLREPNVPLSDTPKARLSHTATDLSSAVGNDPGIQDWGELEDEDQGTLPNQPQNAPAEPMSGGGAFGKSAHKTVRAGGSGGECRPW